MLSPKRSRAARCEASGRWLGHKRWHGWSTGRASRDMRTKPGDRSAHREVVPPRFGRSDLGRRPALAVPLFEIVKIPCVICFCREIRLAVATSDRPAS